MSLEFRDSICIKLGDNIEWILNLCVYSAIKGELLKFKEDIIIKL